MIRILDKNICALIVKRFFRRSKDIPNSQFLSGKIAGLGMKQYPLVFLLSCTGHPLLSRRRKSPSSSRRRVGEVWRTRVCVLLWWSLINSVSCPPLQRISAFSLIHCPSALIIAFIYANTKLYILKDCLSTPADAKHNSWILMQLGITTIWGLFFPP